MTAKTANSKTRRKPDLEVIVAEGRNLELGGIPCTVKRLKAREFFQLISVVTSTLGANAGEIFARMEEKKDDEDFTAELVGVILVAVPLAMDPFLRLLRDVVEPVENADAEKLHDYLWNPEPMDVLEIVDGVMENEKENLRELVGKGRAYLTKWSKMMSGVRGPKSST